MIKNRDKMNRKILKINKSRDRKKRKIIEKNLVLM